MINLIIVDDHILVQNGIKNMLENESNINILASFDRGKPLLDYLQNNSVDIILLDINLPDSNGLQLCKEIRRKYEDTQIIGLTSFNESDFIRTMMRNGAKGYLLKNTNHKELILAINTVYKGEVFLPQTLKDKLLNEDMGIKQSSNAFVPKLSRREKEVLKHISEEYTNNEIGEALFISIKTVETHRRNLLHKFDCRNTAGLIKKAMSLGLLS
ncbi:MAG: response regulator [Flavobacteriales bacterium]